MSTLYRIAYYLGKKNIPAWYEQKRPKTETSRSPRPTDGSGAVAEEGLVLKILFTLVQRFVFAHFQYGGFQGFFMDGR